MITEQYCGKCERPMWVHSSFGKQECPPEDLVLGEPLGKALVLKNFPETEQPWQYSRSNNDWNLQWEAWVAAVKEWETKITAEIGPQS